VTVDRFRPYPWPLGEAATPLTPLVGDGEIEGDVSMDQRGALAPGTVERLILWAKEDRFRGSIDLRGDHTATIAFSSGFVAHIDIGDGEVPASDETKERVHGRLTRRLATLLALDDGSYVIHRTDQLPPEARWLFGPQGLLEAARTLTERTPASRWSAAEVQLDDRSVQGPVELSADAFRVVVALARTIAGQELQADLGWNAARFDHALDELDLAHVLHPSTMPARPLVQVPPVLPARSAPVVDLTRREPAPEPATAPPSEASRPATPIMAARGAAAKPMPAPPSTDAGDGGRTRASALRRLIQNLR
jgi:hypothetical protein